MISTLLLTKGSNGIKVTYIKLNCSEDRALGKREVNINNIKV